GVVVIVDVELGVRVGETTLVGIGVAKTCSEMVQPLSSVTVLWLKSQECPGTGPACPLNTTQKFVALVAPTLPFVRHEPDSELGGDWLEAPLHNWRAGGRVKALAPLRSTSDSVKPAYLPQ